VVQLAPCCIRRQYGRIDDDSDEEKNEHKQFGAPLHRKKTRVLRNEWVLSKTLLAYLVPCCNWDPCLVPGSDQI
jgi:hypothetical protein